LFIARHERKSILATHLQLHWTIILCFHRYKYVFWLLKLTRKIGDIYRHFKERDKQHRILREINEFEL